MVGESDETIARDAVKVLMQAQLMARFDMAHTPHNTHTYTHMHTQKQQQ